MTQVSRRKVTKDIQDRISEIFFKVVVELRSEDEVASFLDEFLTPTEKIVLSKRMAIALLLMKNYDYETISEILKVTPNTIARTSYWVRHKGRGLNVALRKIIEGEKWEGFWNQVAYIAGRVMVLQKGANWSRRRGKVEAEHQKSQKRF